MVRKNIFLPGLLLFCFFLNLLIFQAGCWDRREPDFLGVVTAAAFDFEPQTGRLQVIAQVANSLGIGTGESGGGNGGGGGGKNLFWVVEAGGQTIYEALKNIDRVSSRKLLWSHLEVVLFSEEMAREGLLPILDYIDRERQARLIARPFVVQGDVRQLLETEFPLEQLGGPALIRQLLTIRMETAFVPEVESLRRLFSRLAKPGMELILPCIAVQAEKDEKGGPESGKDTRVKTGEPNPAKLSGGALFRGDKLVGFFNEKETAGYLWLTNNIRRLTMVFNPPGEKDRHLTVEVFGAAVKLTPEVQGEQVRVHLTVHTKGRLQDFTGQKLPLAGDFKNSLNRRMATVIQNQIGLAWQKAREMNLDVFGIGHTLYQTKPQDWKRLERKWANIFPEVELEVEVQATIKSFGLVADPINIHRTPSW